MHLHEQEHWPDSLERIEEEDMFSCPHDGCEEQFARKVDLDDHIARAHTKEHSWHCKKCNKAFFSEGELKQHMKSKKHKEKD